MLQIANKEDWLQIESLFGVLLQENGGQNPNSRRIEEEGGIKEWLSLGSPRPRLVIKEEGRVIGFVQLRSPLERGGALNLIDYYQKAFPSENPGTLVIVQRLAVLPEARRRGLGRQLLKAAMQLSKGLGVRGAVIEKSQKASLNLFLSEGWRETHSYTGTGDKEMVSLTL